MTEKEARSMRALIVQGSVSLTDAQVSTAPEVLHRMVYDGSLISNGTRINWNGTIKRAAVDLWDREDQNPENAPDLWETVMYKDGYRIIPDVITVGQHFSKGELGWWGETLYRSIIDNNVWTPDKYPDAWEVCIEE